MATVIDRRSSGNRASASNDRLQRRVSERLKEAVNNVARSGSLKEVMDGKKVVKIPAKDLNEPTFRHDTSQEDWERVLPGNKEYQKNDGIAKPKTDNQSGKNGSPDGEFEGEIDISLSTDDFINLLFDGLELPDLLKRQKEAIEQQEYRRSGYVKDGMPSKLNLRRTMQTAKARRIGLRGQINKELQALLESQKSLTKEIADRLARGLECDIELDHLKSIEQRILTQQQNRKIPFIDSTDLRYNHSVEVPVLISQAVMFCIMDTSGSMQEQEKDLARRFFILLYLFIKQQYKTVDIVFIRHDTSAHECTETEFFGITTGGGTIISSALNKTVDIIKDRYPLNEWNVYFAQASDGDNYYGDNPYMVEIVQNLLRIVQYGFYVEVNRQDVSSVMELYHDIAEDAHNFKVLSIGKTEDVYPLFRQLFNKMDTLI